LQRAPEGAVLAEEVCVYAASKWRRG